MHSYYDYLKEGGGIPQRYKSMGFTRVGQKKQGDGQHKWKVLAKKGNQYKVVQGGYRGMQDFSQHGSKKRQSNFWSRMGGKNSSKAKDPFSPLYWHKRLGKWEDGGMMFNEVPGGDISIPNLTTLQVGGYFPRFMEEGGDFLNNENDNINNFLSMKNQMKNGGTNNPGFKALPQYVQNKILSRMGDGGDTGTFSGNAYYQQGGGMPQPPQQGGGQEEQLMQLIQAYAQIAQIDPNEIVKQLQQMQPQEQQQAVQQMAQALQEASSGGGGQQQEQMMPQEELPPQMMYGGRYQYGGEMGGMYMPSTPAVSIYDLPIYQENGYVENPVQWHPEWNQMDDYGDANVAYNDEDAMVAEANARALAESPNPQMQQFIPQQYSTAPVYQGSSIVDYLKSIGQDSSVEARKRLAAEKGISNYARKDYQNLQLLDILRGGKSTIPTGRVTAKSASKKAQDNSQTEEELDAQEEDFRINLNDGNILRQGYSQELPLMPGIAERGKPTASGGTKKSSKGLSTGEAIGGVSGILALLAGTGLTAVDLISTDWEKLGSNSPFSGNMKRKLTLARKKIINEAMKKGASSAAEAVNELKRVPKKIRDILNNLDAMEISGDIYQMRPGTAIKDVQAYNALTEARAEEALINKLKSQGLLPEQAGVAAKENAFMKALKSGYGAMREAPLVTKAGKLMKYFRKEDGGELEMMQDGQEFTPEWWGRQAIQFMDPTGITSYGDVYDTFNNPNASYFDKGISAFSALPVVGKLGKAAKIANIGIKGAQKASKLSNIYNKASKVLTPIRAFDRMNPLGAGVGEFNRAMLQNAPRAVRGIANVGSDFNQGRRFFQAGDIGISGLDRAMGYTPKQAEGGYMDPAWMKSGGININPANKGKFTASAQRAGMGVQEFARKVLANKEDYSSTQVKRANFARNAAKWKHQEGGSIDVGSYVDDTPEMRAWLDSNGYTYE